MIYSLIVFLISGAAFSYVPTVESLFRHGSNPDVIANGLNITFSVKKINGTDKSTGSLNDASLLKEERTEDFYKLFFTVSGDFLKIAQTRYKNNSFSEASLEQKIFYPNLNAFSIKPTVEQLEKGLFFALLHSMALNNGSHMVSYLKALGVPVKLNTEIINRDKVELLASYKRYLALINRDRSAKATLKNPLQPEDSTAKQRVNELMNESMYIDSNQVALSKDEGKAAWVVKADTFEGVFSYKERDVQRITFKSQAGEFEILCKDYWLANGTHALPRYMIIKTLSGQIYQVEILNLRHYVEKEDDLVKRLKNWDLLLKGKVSTDSRPEFLF